MEQIAYSNENEWQSMIGTHIEKISGKPFKSGLKADYPMAIEVNPYTNKKAFRMRMCNSLVDCHMCKTKTT